MQPILTEWTTRLLPLIVCIPSFVDSHIGSDSVKVCAVLNKSIDLDSRENRSYYLENFPSQRVLTELVVPRIDA